MQSARSITQQVLCVSKMQGEEAKNQWLINLIIECISTVSRPMESGEYKAGFDTAKKHNIKAILRAMRKMNLVTEVCQCRPYTRSKLFTSIGIC